jgi:hypothetical protein
VQQERKSFKNCWKWQNFSTQNKKSSTDSQSRKLILYCAYTEPRLQINGPLNSRIWTILNSNIWNCVYWSCKLLWNNFIWSSNVAFECFFINQSWKILLLTNSYLLTLQWWFFQSSKFNLEANYSELQCLQQIWCLSIDMQNAIQ